MLPDSRPTTVAVPAVVPGASGITDRPSASPTLPPPAPTDAAQQPRTRQHPHTQSARMQAIIDATIDRGFSAEVSARIAHGRLRTSSELQYDSRWNAFSDWCRERQADPVTAPVGVLANFLTHLFVDRQRSLPVVLGVRTAVNSVWKAHGCQEADDYLMGQLFKNFKMERPALR